MAQTDGSPASHLVPLRHPESSSVNRTNTTSSQAEAPLGDLPYIPFFWMSSKWNERFKFDLPPKESCRQLFSSFELCSSQNLAKSGKTESSQDQEESYRTKSNRLNFRLKIKPGFELCPDDLSTFDVLLPPTHTCPPWCPTLSISL